MASARDFRNGCRETDQMDSDFASRKKSRAWHKKVTRRQAHPPSRPSQIRTHPITISPRSGLASRGPGPEPRGLGAARRCHPAPAPCRRRPRAPGARAPRPPSPAPPPASPARAAAAPPGTARLERRGQGRSRPGLRSPWARCSPLARRCFPRPGSLGPESARFRRGAATPPGPRPSLLLLRWPPRPSPGAGWARRRFPAASPLLEPGGAPRSHPPPSALGPRPALPGSRPPEKHAVPLPAARGHIL